MSDPTFRADFQGRKKKQKPAPTAGSAGERLRLAKQLALDIEGHIDRDEEVPPLFSEAYEQFQGDASLMMASPNRTVRMGFGGLAQAMEDRLKNAVQRARDRADPEASLSGNPFVERPDTRRIDLPDPEADLDGLEYAVDRETVRNATIFGAPLQDGHLVTDSDGITWDLSEALETYQQPEVLKRLRQAQMGLIPGPAAAAHTIGAMPLMQLAIEGASKLGIGDNRRNVETAYAGMTLPWLVGLNPDGSMRGDEIEKLQDPVWARALKETLEGLDLESSPAEAFAHAAVGGLDFVAFNRLGKLVGKGLAGAAIKLPTSIPKVLAARALDAAKKIPKATLPGASVARTVGDFMLYESLVQATNPTTSALDNALHGLEQGLVFGVAGAGARLLRGVTKTALRLPRGASGAGVQRNMDDVIAAVKGSTLPLTRELARQELRPYAIQAAEHALDAHVMGVLVHSWGAAQAAEPGDRFATFWRNLFTAESHATGLGFALNSAFQYAAFTRPAVQKYTRSPEFAARAKNVAAFWATPGASESLREAFERFERMKAEDPAAFAGLEFVVPPERQPRDVEVEVAGARPTNAAEAYEAMRQDAAAEGTARPLLAMGEFHVEHLRILGFAGKSDAGVYKHALNAVHEYLRRVERNTESRYERLSEVPEALMRRMLEWRDAGKPNRREFERQRRDKVAGQLRIEDALAAPPEAAKEPARPVVAPSGLDRPPPAETRGKGVWFHGSPSEIKALVDQGPGSNYYGTGFYTTEALDIAHGYARRKGAKAPTVYAVKELAPVKFFDLETKAEGRLADHIRANEQGLPELAEALAEVGERGGTWREVFDVTRELSSSDTGVSRSEIIEQFDAFSEALREQGYGGLTHRGGLRTKKPEHNVRIYLDPPKQVSLHRPGEVERTELEADRLLRQVEGEPAYQGLAPLEQLAKAEERAITRRPVLGKAIKAVIEGKETPEWLRENFPEGSEVDVSGKPEQWVGTFDAAVRAVWKADKARRARGNLAGIRQRRPHTIVDAIKKLGGLSPEAFESGEVKQLGEDYPGLVRKKGLRKLDDLAERLWEDGFFHERPSINELLDAIAENRQHPSTAGQRSTFEQGRDAAIQFEANIQRHREAIESGEAPMPSREELYGIFAGDARFHGITPEALEKDIRALRAQAEVGDPGPVMASPPETVVSLARRAAVKTERAIDALRALEVIDSVEPPQSANAIGALGDLLANRRPASVPEAEWGLAREVALEAQAETRETLRRAMEGTWEARDLERLEDAWRAIDASTAGHALPPELAGRLKEWLDERGELSSSAIDRLQQETYEHLWNLSRATDETSFQSFFSALAFGGRKFTDVGDNRFGAMVRERLWLDNPKVQRLLGRPLARKAWNFVTAAMGRNMVFPMINLGPVSAPQSSKLRARNRAMLFSLGVERGHEQGALLVAQIAGDMLTRPWGGDRMPQAHQDLMVEWWESGVLGKARGPEDLERLRPGTGYLFEPYKRLRSEIERLGRELVGIGRMTQGEFDSFAGGKYLGHFFIKAQAESDMLEVSQGRLPVRYAGRSMARENGLPSIHEPIMSVPDAAWRAQRSIYEEARTLRVFRALFKPMDDPALGALSKKQLDEMRGTFDHGDYELAAVKVERRPGETWPQAAARYAAMKRYPWRAILMGARLGQDREMMAPRGEPKGVGQRAYTRRMEELYEFYLERETYIPARQAAELEIVMTDIFAPPGQASKIGAAFDQLFAFKKRGLTLFSPRQWTLMFASNIERNHVLGGVPRSDAIRGFFGLPSFTRDGIDGLQTMMRWIREDAPTKKPDAWSDAEWSNLIRARRFMELTGNSTSLVTSLGAEFAANFGGGSQNPEVTRGAWMARMNEMAALGGWSPTEREEMRLAIGAKISQEYRGLEWLDSKILGLLGEHNPVSEAKAKTMYSTAWNLIDLFFFKYPAFLKMMHENPHATLERLLHQSLRKTTDAGDTDPFFRSYASMRAPWADATRTASQGRTVGGLHRARVKLWAAQFIRDRFWIDQVSMMPQVLAGMVRHPIRSAASVAVMAGIAAMLGAAWDDEDRALWEEEQLTARRAIGRWPATPGAELEALERFGSKIGNFAGLDATFPDDVRTKMGEWWRQSYAREGAKALAGQLGLTDPGAYPAPRRGGDTQTGSLLEFTPAGSALNAARTAGKIAGPIAASLTGGEGVTSREGARELLDGLERVAGMRAQVAAGMALGAISPNSTISEALGGDGAGLVIAKTLANLAGTAGFMHSPLGLFTPEGQYIGEAVFLDGQRWNQNLRGVSRFYTPEGSGERLAGVASRLMWPSRSVFQRDPMQSPVDGYTAILSEMYPGFNPSSASGRAKIGAHAWVSEQMSVMLADLYDQFFEEVLTDPAKSDWTLDEMVRGALLETFEHTDEDRISGHGFIEPHYAPQGTLLKALAALPEEKRGVAIPHLKTWASGARFREDGMSLLFQAGRSAEMPKEMFREAIGNALRDPSGTNLVKWWWSKVEHSDDETLGLLAPLMYDVKTPAGGEALAAFRKLIVRYAQADYEWPPVPEDAEVGKEVPLAPGNARALQGGAAFRRVLFEKQSALEELLEPR